MAAQAITSQDINALTGRTYPVLESGVPSLFALPQRLAAWYEAHRRYRETVFELSRLSDHLLADLGIGRHQIDETARAQPARCLARSPGGAARSFRRNRLHQSGLARTWGGGYLRRRVEEIKLSLRRRHWRSVLREAAPELEARDQQARRAEASG